MKRIEGQIVDIHARRTFPGAVIIDADRIVSIETLPSAPQIFILPGFVDAHVHIESSMLTPAHFSRLVIGRGTVGVVTDPHEIGNVLGEKGIDFMLDNARQADIKCFFTIPSCVPATPFDSAGAVIDAAQVERMAASGKFVALSEMMNIPGVLTADAEVMKKLQAVQAHGLPTDGHAPLLRGEALAQYVAAGISTDHESMLLEEGEEKARLGMHVLIREGSAARNYNALHPMLRSCPDMVMFCTDDAHPDDLIERGHIDKTVRRAIADGYDLYNVLRAASLHPVQHYKLPVGLLREGDHADFIIVDNLKDFTVLESYINGRCAYKKGEPQALPEPLTHCPNNFSHEAITTAQLRQPVSGTTPVIQLIPNELITEVYQYTPPAPTDNLESDLTDDVLKIVYLNRYQNGAPQVAYIRGFGLKQGALASSIGHDSHNIVAVGTNDTDLTTAINAVISQGGGLSVANPEAHTLALPIAGIMSPLTGEEVAESYQSLSRLASALGTPLHAPFMTLAFMSLVVIPNLKIGERGLFDYTKFNWINA